MYSIPVLIAYLDSQRSPCPHLVLLARGPNTHFATTGIPQAQGHNTHQATITLASHVCEAPTSTMLSHSAGAKPTGTNLYDAPMGTALAVHAKRLGLPDPGHEAHSCDALTGTISLSAALLFGPLASQRRVWGVVLS